MIQELLQQEGIDVLVQRARGFDVPDFLAGGPRELYVRREQLEAARAIVASHFGLDDGSERRVSTLFDRIAPRYDELRGSSSAGAVLLDVTIEEGLGARLGASSTSAAARAASRPWPSSASACACGASTRRRR